MLTREQFLIHLRDALNHLDDPDNLRRNPLADLFGVAGRFDTSSRLSDILTQAIESLEPGTDEPPHSRAWHIYETLFYRYVQRLKQREAAYQLGICTRHVRRKQHAALSVLGDLLWERFNLGQRLATDADVETMPSGLRLHSATVSQELAWLKTPPLGDPSDVHKTIPDVINLAQPLADQEGVHLEFALVETLPNLAVDPIALRQMLLNLLSVAISRTPKGQVRVSARPKRWEVEIQVWGAASASVRQSLSNDEAVSMAMVHRLADLSGGRLTVSAKAELFDATLILPALERLPVLVIDDNIDTLHLLRRYTLGTRFRLVTTQDPEQALELAERFAPQIIVLDVMMPEVDGWEVLGRLRGHPLTGYIPIVVCTILAQEKLALSLGASDFVRKPVTQQAFLSVLERQIELMEPEPG